MMKIALGLVTALMLAACAYTGVQTASAPVSGGAGHPDNTYPGPKAY
jgi:hypothetical protein